MADRAGLGFVGFIFGGVTAAVMLVAVTVVIGHVDGRLVLDASAAEYSPRANRLSRWLPKEENGPDAGPFPFRLSPRASPCARSPAAPATSTAPGCRR